MTSDFIPVPSRNGSIFTFSTSVPVSTPARPSVSPENAPHVITAASE